VNICKGNEEQKLQVDKPSTTSEEEYKTTTKRRGNELSNHIGK